MRIEPLYQCPFCGRHRTTGVIAVDLHALIRAVPAAGKDRVKEEVEWATDESRRIFIFNPDGVPNRPCPHVVSFILDAEVTERRGGGEVEWRVTHSISWDHPWFAANDPDKELEVYLWTEVDLGVPETAFYPSTRYEIDPVGFSRRVPGSRLKLVAGGTIIVALDAPRFLEELRDGVRRLRAFEQRARSEGPTD